MRINAQMRRGLERVMNIDSDTAAITRPVYTDNGRDSRKPTGETHTHYEQCRVSYEGGGVWHRGEWVGGLATDTTPYILADARADIKTKDLVVWRGKRYTVGAVTYPQLDGGSVCLQAPLTEVH
jgi:hypothetical protein